MSQRLNYDKWSNDSDIEGHPNVDHKSLVRWKQRDIHEKREQRKFKLAALRSEIEMNGVIGPRMDEIIAQLKKEGAPYVERTVGQLRQATQTPGKEGDRPPGSSKGPTYDMMILELLRQVVEEVKSKGLDGEARNEAMTKSVQQHRKQLDDRTAQCKKEIEQEEAEAQKKITSEDMHDGFSTSHLSSNPASQQIVDDPRPKSKQPDAKGKGKETAIEVLNPSAPAQPTPVAEETDEEVIPELTSNADAFSLIPIDKPEKLFGAISRDPSLLKPSTTDALLMKAFNAAMKADAKLCRQCIHNGLVLQYATKLGKDGVALFFSRLQGGPGREVFLKDVNDTFARIWKRGNEMAAEDRAKKANGEEEGEEQIQLVAQDPNVRIGFDVPDGPPPEHITLEGEGTEDLDVEEVKAFLQRRWDIFDSFPRNLRKALQANDLEAVNKVLGRMAVDQAEEVVEQLQEARILSFSEPGVRDETGKA